jgi:hypothetical protein
MATKMTVAVEDDLDGGSGGESVRSAAQCMRST